MYYGLSSFLQTLKLFKGRAVPLVQVCKRNILFKQRFTQIQAIFNILGTKSVLQDSSIFESCSKNLMFFGTLFMTIPKEIAFILLWIACSLRKKFSREFNIAVEAIAKVLRNLISRLSNILQFFFYKKVIIQ